MRYEPLLCVELLLNTNERIFKTTKYKEATVLRREIYVKASH